MMSPPISKIYLVGLEELEGGEHSGLLDCLVVVQHIHILQVIKEAVEKAHTPCIKIPPQPFYPLVMHTATRMTLFLPIPLPTYIETRTFSRPLSIRMRERRPNSCTAEEKHVNTVEARLLVDALK